MYTMASRRIVGSITRAARKLPQHPSPHRGASPKIYHQATPVVIMVGAALSGYAQCSCELWRAATLAGRLAEDFKNCRCLAAAISLNSNVLLALVSSARRQNASTRH